MESKDGLKEINIKNHTCCYINDRMRVININFGKILLNQKSYKEYKNKLIHGISYKPLMGSNHCVSGLMKQMWIHQKL